MIPWNTNTLLERFFQPPLDSIDAWCRLCFGKFQAQRFSDATGDFGDRSAKPGNAELSDEEIGVPPYLSIVGFMDQNSVVQVLEYHLNWFEETGFTQEQVRGLYIASK